MLTQCIGCFSIAARLQSVCLCLTSVCALSHRTNDVVLWPFDELFVTHERCLSGRSGLDQVSSRCHQRDAPVVRQVAGRHRGMMN